MTTAILQARMGSSRLPGKMTMPIFDGKGPLELMLLRLRESRSLARVIVATTSLPEDDVLAEICARLDVACFRGHPTDVLDRYYQCAKEHHALDTLVRLTGDCPLHDPKVVDSVIEFFKTGGYDYAANTHPPTFPDGLDVEVFSFAALETAWRKATLLTEREHVTYYLYTHPEEFRVGNLTRNEDLSHLRWTFDEPEDLEFLRQIYAKLGRATASADEVLGLLNSHPDLHHINHRIKRNEGLAKSLEKDKASGNLI
ncbi:MAG TPA: glycosyltransferase family protein [Burkholderiales bacterium]|nr:glycosyltransferase family protein [Burkholderiales bacterium]